MMTNDSAYNFFSQSSVNHLANQNKLWLWRSQLMEDAHALSIGLN